MKPTLQKAISLINSYGALLVFPIKNRLEPLSLWSQFFPNDNMVWEWTDDSDDRVARLWHLREELSRSGDVVYAKWYQGRATFFAPPLFSALLQATASAADPLAAAPPSARKLLGVLSEDSPLPTKQLKLEIGLEGKAHEPEFTRALKALWDRLLIVGHGEVEEGGFPSLAIGATRLLFEDLWNEARQISHKESQARIDKYFAEGNLFRKSYLRMLKILDSPYQGR